MNCALTANYNAIVNVKQANNKSNNNSSNGNSRINGQKYTAISPPTQLQAQKQPPNSPHSDRVEWSRATILGFIEDYRRQRVLWDPNTKGYHIKQTKYEALKALGEKYGAEIRSIRSKIKSLRSSFHREHGKVVNGRRKGLNYQPMWFAYDAIRFILDGETTTTLINGNGHGNGVDNGGNSIGTNRDANDMPIIISHETTRNNNNDNNNNNKNNSSNNDINKSLSNISRKYQHLTEASTPIIGVTADWCDSANYNSEDNLTEDRCKYFSRNIEQFNNHLLALGLQSRHPMVMIATTEPDNNDDPDNSSNKVLQFDKHSTATATAAQLKFLELSRHHQLRDSARRMISSSKKVMINNNNNSNNNNNNHNNHNNHHHQNYDTSNMLSPLPATTMGNDSLSSHTITTNLCSSIAAAAAATATASASTIGDHFYISSTKLQNLNDNSSVTSSTATITASAVGISASGVTGAAAATLLPSSLTITSVARTNDFDSDFDYGNICAGDVKTEIIESDTPDLELNYDRARSSVFTPLNYYKNIATDLTVNRNNSERKRKIQTPTINVSDDGDITNEEMAPPIKSRCQEHMKHKEHSITATHFKEQCDFLRNFDINCNNSNSTSLRTTGTAKTSSDANSNHIHGNNDQNDDNHNKINSNSKDISNNTAIDEYGVFGEYVAITVRRLKTSKAKIVVKHLINNILYEAELGKYDQGMPAYREPPELYKM